MKGLNFPQHMIEEILKRLPVKSLLRFKSISRLWKFLISSTSFIRLHRETIQTVGKKFLLSTDDKCRELVLLDYDEAYFAAINLNFPSNREYRRIEIVGSCNGLVAVAVDYHLFLWNPLIGNPKKLPCPCSVLGLAQESFHVCFCRPLSFWGFGYDSSSDDYKLILETIWGDRVKVVIFSSKTESWRIIEPHSPLFRQKGVHISGCLHWLSHYNDIFGFDLKTENLSKIPVPDNMSSVQRELGAFDGKLCVTEYNYETKQLQLWVTKEYGDGESWSILLTLDNKVLSRFDLPLCFSEDNALIYMKKKQSIIRGDDNSAIMCYRLSSMICKLHLQETQHITRCNFDQPVVYQESLVSPDKLGWDGID